MSKTSTPTTAALLRQFRKELREAQIPEEVADSLVEALGLDIVRNGLVEISLP